MCPESTVSSPSNAGRGCASTQEGPHLAALHEHVAQGGVGYERLHGRAHALGKAADEVQGADDELALRLDRRRLPVGRCAARLQLHRQDLHAPVKGRLRVGLVRAACTATAQTCSGASHEQLRGAIGCM